MNNFTYRSNEEKDNLEAILRKRKRKFNLQQWVARLIIIGIIGSLLYYAADHVMYTDVDGYVHVDANVVRAPFDMYLDSVYVSTGKFVNPGDTLYSYYVLDLLLEGSNPYNVPSVLSNSRELKIKYQTTSGEIAVTKESIKSLTYQIDQEDRNISFGLSTNSHKMDLERRLKEEKTRLSALYTELSLLAKMLKGIESEIDSRAFSPYSAPMIFDDANSAALKGTRRYRICTDSSLVTNVVAPDKMILFKKDNIMRTQHLDLDGNNLSIVCYVPINKMRNIYEGTKAKVIVDRDQIFDATVYAVGLRTDEIPVNLRSYFAKKTTALIAELRFDPQQDVPFWCLASGLPVTLRIKNYDVWKLDRPEDGRLRYITGSAKYNFNER